VFYLNEQDFCKNLYKSRWQLLSNLLYSS
jgi:hypothetical protein